MDGDSLSSAPQRLLPVPPGYARGAPLPWWLKLGTKLALAGVGLHGPRARVAEQVREERGRVPAAREEEQELDKMVPDEGVP